MRKILWLLLSVGLCCGCASVTQGERANITLSLDGTPISYSEYGLGKTALVFVHGWNCDSRYWRMQVPVFAKKYKVVTLDLAGHGHSGYNRKKYSFENYADDVDAVVKAIDAKEVILIGHSMSDYIIGLAALKDKGKVKGLIGVDTIQNLEDKADPKMIEGMLSGLRADFAKNTKEFVYSILGDKLDQHSKDLIALDMSAAPAISATETMSNYFAAYANGSVARVYDQIDLPVYCINARLWPTNFEINKKHIKKYKLLFIEGCGHFPMLEDPREFNKKLNEAVNDILHDEDKK